MIPKEPTDVEKQVLAAFQADDISVVDADGAEISGDFLRGLFLGKYDKNADYRGTCIANAVVSDALNMEFCETKFPVRFHNCSFVREIKIQQLVCPELDFRGCTLKGELDARMVKVAGSMNMNKVSATSTVSLANAHIGGQLVCTGGNFQNKEGYAFHAPDIKVVVDVFLNDGFVAVGEVNLAGADIGRQLVCTGGNFWNNGGNAINAQSIKAGGMLLNSDSSDKQSIKEFKAEGAVWLAGAEIGGQLNCEGGIFQNKGGIALNAHGIKVASDVLLIPHARNKRDEWENLSANGLVSFVNATIGGNFMLHSCKLTHLSLAGANILGEFQDDANIYKDQNGNDIVLDIDGFRYHRLDATKERVKDRLEWVDLMSQGDEFRPQPYEQLMKVYREMGHMNWAWKVGFALEKKRHKQLRLNRDHKRFVVLGWAWWIWYWALRGTIGYGYKPFRALYWFIFLIAVGFTLLSGASFCPNPYRTESAPCHCMAPSDAEVLLSADWKVHGKLPKDYPDFNFVYYAVEAALPVLPLGQTENWHPKTWWLRWLQGAITIIGALVLTILASYGVGVLGPRWKDG